jgi:Protein kinase domain.
LTDLHLGNVLFRLPTDIDGLSSDELYEKYGKSTLEPFTRLDGCPLPTSVPAYSVVPIWLGATSKDIDLPAARIILTDFGESFMPSTTRRHFSNIPLLSIPPEVQFLPGESLSFSADIWALGCIIWEVLGQRPIFESFLSTADRVTEEHIEVFDKLPLEWRERWEKETRREWFRDDEAGIKVEDVQRSETDNTTEEKRSWEDHFEELHTGTQKRERHGRERKKRSHCLKC